MLDRKIIKELRKALVLESIFSGAASMSKVFEETENELEDMLLYVDKKVKVQNLLDGKLFKNRK